MATEHTATSVIRSGGVEPSTFPTHPVDPLIRPQRATPSTPVASFSDPSANPLYIHGSDHAGIALVSEKLTGLGNFSTWRRSMIMALRARNKLVFVDGSFPDLEPTHPDYGSWSRCISIVCTWIVNAVEKDIAKSIMYLDSARQMWLDIHDQFKQNNAPRTAEIKQMLYQEVQGHQTVSAYYTRLKQLWEELKNHENVYICCCGTGNCPSVKFIMEEKEQDRVMKFLLGLDDSYKGIRGQIFMMDPKPSLTKVFNLVAQEERQRNMSNIPPASAPVFQISEMSNVSGSQIATDNSNLIAAYGHFKGKGRPICSHCGMHGHTVNKCYKLHGYPPGYKIGQSQNTSKPVSTHTSQPQSGQTHKKEGVVNLISHEVTGANANGGVHQVTADQVQRLLSVLNISQEDLNKGNQIAGTNFSIPSDVPSSSQSQSHIPTLPSATGLSSGVYSGLSDW